MDNTKIEKIAARGQVITMVVQAQELRKLKNVDCMVLIRAEGAYISVGYDTEQLHLSFRCDVKWEDAETEAAKETLRMWSHFFEAVRSIADYSEVPTVPDYDSVMGPTMADNQ